MRRTLVAATLVAGLGLGLGAGIASGGGSAAGAATPASRLDDGKDLLPQAMITEGDAVEAAQTAATGPLNEVDLEHYQGKLVFNVDVGSHDVKVAAANGDVLASPQDD
jgi:uncharacterized membrane protein YkoI